MNAVHVRWLRLALLGALSLAAATVVPAATYHVATDGEDGQPGSVEQPWRTIQRAVVMLQAGDTAIVHEGTYDERITTMRSGTSETNRISFLTDGAVVMRGWVVNHAYITVCGFDITGHPTAASPLDAYVRVNNGGDHFALLDCTVRDGIGLKRDDMLFTAPNLISTPTGGFLEAGFAAGQGIAVLRGTNVTVVNSGGYTVDSVTETSLVVAGGGILDEGPKTAYITASANFGLYTASGSWGAVIESNQFDNLSYDYWLITGRDHLLESNVVSRNNGWDMVFFAGSNHVFRANFFRDNGWGVYSPSADIFDNWSSIRYENIRWTQNFHIGEPGSYVINAQKYSTNASGPLFITGNVFIDTGRFAARFPNTTVAQNSFLRVARTGTPAVSVARHALHFNTADYATNAVIRNNIFVDCGEAKPPQYPEEEIGWYEFTGPTESVVTEGNYVAGPAPAYGAKVGWLEGNPLLNGDDPGFVDINDPLGSDGLPFTADDGLRLLASSKLLGAGAGGLTVGAYGVPLPDPPLLTLQLTDQQGVLRLAWPQTAETWTFQSSPNLLNPWTDFSKEPLLEDGQFQLTIHPVDPAGFYRLRRQ